MNIYVQLNDVFDETTPTVMEQRIQNAFGADGTDFWKNFFFCDRYHPDEKAIYLFTEHQLWFLWNWWHNKYTTSSLDIQLKLDYSRQKLFNTLQNSGEFKQIIACYVRSVQGYLKIQRVYFGAQPPIYLPHGGLEMIDFFDGGFRDEPPSKSGDEAEYKKRLLDLVGLRKMIANEFGGIEYKNPDGSIRKWLRYLGPQHAAPACMDYCTGLYTNCPLARNTINIGNSLDKQLN